MGDGTTDPVAEAAFLICEALHLSPDQFESFAHARLTAAEGKALLDLIHQRITTRKPTAYLVNKIYMRGLPFYVDERVIVPRSFIGELLDSHFGGDGEAGSLIDDPTSVARVLDLCTGSGCLAILAAYHFPNAEVDAVDVSKGALEVAARNVGEHGLDERITLHRGDLFAPLGGNKYDLIITNPPYVDAEGMAALQAASAQGVTLYGGESIVTSFDASITGDLGWNLPGGAVTPRTCAQNDPNIVPSTITTTSATIEPSTAVTAMSP